MKFHSKPCLIQNPFLTLGCNNIFEQPLSNHLRMRCQSTNKKTSICIPNSRSLIPNSQSPILNLLLNPHSSIFDPQFSIRNIQSLALNPKRQPPIFNPNHYFNSHSFIAVIILIFSILIIMILYISLDNAFERIHPQGPRQTTSLRSLTRAQKNKNPCSNHI